MAIESILSAHRAELRKPNRGSAIERVYFDPRQRDYPDLGGGSAVYTLAREDNLIDRGNCESTTPPSMFGETTNNLSNCTFARASDFARSGEYSYKLTKTIAAGTASVARAQENVTTTDMHGIVAGESLEIELYVYIPTASGIAASEVALQSYYHNGTGWVSLGTDTASTLDAWERLSLAVTVPSTALGMIVVYIQVAATAADTEYFYVDDIRVRTHNVPGSHYLSSGYTEHLVALADTGVMQVKFKPTFAHDTASNQYIASWYVSATQFFALVYRASLDMFTLQWYDGGTERSMASAQYDDGTAERNINQWITLTLSYDLTTGDTTGASLWMNGTQDDTAWSGNIDAKSTTFGKMQIRAYNGTAGAYDIAYVKYWPNTTITALSGLDTTLEEEIYWCFDGHGTGRTRCLIDSDKVQSVEVEYSRNNPYSGAHSANRATVTLTNQSGEFSDDQYAAFDASAEQYNGTAAQKYLQNRNRVWIETHYSGDWDHVLVGQIDAAGWARSTLRDEDGTVTLNVDDAVALLARKRVQHAVTYQNDELTATAEADSLLHQIAKLGSKTKVRNYSADSNVDGTIGNSYLVTGGTLTQEADPYFGTNCAQLANASGSPQQLYQTITFLANEKINVGETWSLIVRVKSAAAATQTIRFAELDAGGSNDYTDTTYDLDGGEGYVAYHVAHTITDPDSDRLRWLVYVDDGDTVKVDGVHVYQGDREIYWYVENATEGSSGVITADSYETGSYETIGYNLDTVTITHPWRRVESNSSVWRNCMSLAEACGALYFGMDKNNTLRGFFFLGDSYSDPMTSATIYGTTDEGDYLLPQFRTNIDVQTANRIIGRGVIIRAYTRTDMLWSARASDVFDKTSTGYLSESIANGEAWPTDDHGILYAPYGEISGVQKFYEVKQPQWYRELVGGRHGVRVFGNWYTEYSHSLSGRDVVGATAVTLRHRLSDNTAGLTQTTAFYATGDWDDIRADAARVELVNSTGSAVTLVDCYITGKRVMMLSGENGRVHDAFEDRADIERNGERLMEFGNEDVMDATQLRKLAQFYRDYHFTKKHIYSATMVGTRYDMTPGAWYRLQIGGAGETEYIDSVAEVLYLKTRRSVSGDAETVVTFREVEENYKFDSTAVARIISNMGYEVNDANVILIASSTSGSFANSYCDGTADEVEINNAITFLSEAYGGGTVYLTAGTFPLADAIVMKDGVTLIGQGWGTNLEKNGNFYAIEIAGGATTTSDIAVQNLKVSRNASDTNENGILSFDNADRLLVDNVLISGPDGLGMKISGSVDVQVRNVTATDCTGNDPGEYGIVISGSTDVIVESVTVEGSTPMGMQLDQCSEINVSNLRIQGMRYHADSAPLPPNGMYVNSCSNLNVANVTISDIESTDGSTLAYGIYLVGDSMQFSNINISDVTNSATAANAIGFFIKGDDNSITALYVTTCSGTGVSIDATSDRTMIAGGRTTGNTTANYSDGGTNTSTSSFDTT